MPQSFEKNPDIVPDSFFLCLLLLKSLKKSYKVVYFGGNAELFKSPKNPILEMDIQPYDV
jgi:hypothetical protein